jgi:hypothetical protein
VSVEDGRLSGSKTFRFLLVPDSAGTTLLPALRYSYFDPLRRQYQVATAPPLPLVAAPAAGRLSRPLPPPLRHDSRWPLATRLRTAVPDAVWAGLLLLLPAAYALSRARWRRRRGARPVVAADPLADVERRFDAVLARLVADPLEREAGLREALIRVGLEAELAARVVELRHQLQAARYAGPLGPAPDDTLVRRVEEVLGALAGRPGRRRPRAGILTLGLLAAAGAPAQAQSPETLYEAGAFRAAAAGFAERARQAPLVPAHWSNLGAARYREGDDAGALAAWIVGARLRPRDPGLRRALALVPPADAGAARWLWIAPATPDELWIIAAAAWVAGWLGMIRSRRIKGRWVVVLAGAVLFAGLALGLERWYERPLAVTASPEPLRLSPHELAPPVGELPRLAVVRVQAVRGPWRAVLDPEGRRGWLPAEVLVALGS